jgi:3-oxoacyl-[acyl-carrier-protein] synthase II
VTGLGFVSPHGDDPDAVFERICAAESVVRAHRLESLAWAEDPVPMARADFDPGDRIPKIQRIFMSRAGQMAVTAGYDALVRAGLPTDGSGVDDMGVYLGHGLGGSEILEDGYRTHFTRQRRFKPTTVPLIMTNGPTSHVSMRFRMLGPTLTYSNACASSAAAIGEAFRAIRDGYLERAVAGGTEAQLNEGAVAAWIMLGVLAKGSGEDAASACRPFDVDRRGFVLGEGAVMLILESEDAVRERGATPLGEIVGYASASDGHNLTEPHVDGQARAMRLSLADAGLDPECVGYVNAHATGTQVGDMVEVDAIRQVFGAHAGSLLVSATKGLHGHLIGAAAALEGALTLMALKQGRVPPTGNLRSPDPALDLDCVPGQAREVPDLEYALSNSFAFGGTNASLVMRRVDGRP